MTQGKLAEMVDCSDRHIGQIGKAKNISSLAMTVAIANAFIQKLISLTEIFETKDKLMSIEFVGDLTITAVIVDPSAASFIAELK